MAGTRKRPSRGFFAVLFMAFAAVAVGWAQGVIENPAKPRAANAGRVVTPELIATVSDEGTSDFYFSWPRALAAGPDGGLLLSDESQVLMFDANGKFLRNLFKKGQGPGEMPWPGSAFATDKNVVVYSGYPNKLVYFDRSGRYEREIALRSEALSRGGRPTGYGVGRIYFETGEFPRTTGDPDIVDNPRTVLAVNASDGAVKMLGTFVTRTWVVSSPGGGGGAFDVTSVIAAPFDDGALALAHTEDYLIKIYDPGANRVVREFRRIYSRVKGEPLTAAEKKGGVTLNGKHYTRPERRFENDVKNLLVRDGEIWAVTSTKDAAKGVLIDVFDGEGIYRDCFWLKLPEAAGVSLRSPGLCVLDGEFLWVIERAEDETSSIKKYRIPR